MLSNHRTFLRKTNIRCEYYDASFEVDEPFEIMKKRQMLKPELIGLLLVSILGHESMF